MNVTRARQLIGKYDNLGDLHPAVYETLDTLVEETYNLGLNEAYELILEAVEHSTRVPYGGQGVHLPREIYEKMRMFINSRKNGNVA